jgi:hypothetical protein
MPSPDAIKERLTQLPVLCRRPSRRSWNRKEEVWEGGGHFHFFCCEDKPLWNPKTGDTIPAIGYTLSVTGTEDIKTAIAADFIAVLGEPRQNLRTAFRERIWGKNRIAYFDWLQPKDKTLADDSSLAILAQNSVEAYFLECISPSGDKPARLGRTNILPL